MHGSLPATGSGSCTLRSHLEHFKMSGEWLQGTGGWVMVMGAHKGHPRFCQVNLPWISFTDICMCVHIYMYIFIYLYNDSASRKVSRSLTLSSPSPFDHCWSLGTWGPQSWSHLHGSQGETVAHWPSGDWQLLCLSPLASKQPRPQTSLEAQNLRNTCSWEWAETWKTVFGQNCLKVGKESLVKAA